MVKTIENEVMKLNDKLKYLDQRRKYTYQKVINEVSKTDFIILNTLLVGKSLYLSQGERLWSKKDYRRGRNGKKIRQSLSKSVKVCQSL